MKKYAKPEVNVLTTVFEGYLLAGTEGGNNGGTGTGNLAKEAHLFEEEDEEEGESEMKGIKNIN